jgi:protein-histidine pros-kinase
VRKRFPAYGYKEATLNPTNLRDKATEWEAEIVNAFRQQSDKSLIEGQRMEGGRSFLYLARPIKAGAACLLCHSTPETAPASMLRLYGDKHGFGWKTNEIIGAQIITVPEEVPVARAQAAFQTFLLTLVTVFTILGIALHLLMGRLVLDPIERMVESADAISKGKLDVPELAEASTDEVGRLAMAFNRMIRSLKRAMNLLEK